MYSSMSAGSLGAPQQFPGMQLPPLSPQPGMPPGGQQDELTILKQMFGELLKSHKELLQAVRRMEDKHSDLVGMHTEVLSIHQELYQAAFDAQFKNNGAGAKKKAKKHPSLGVIRLDYDYPPAVGDTDCPASFGYDVFYRVVPGLTFERAQAGKFPEEVERRFAEGIKYLEQRGVSAITGDCGFMMAFQVLARKIATRPVFMSSMVQSPIIAAAFDPDDKILILTANGESLKPQKATLLEHCGFKVDDDRFVIKGCQDLPGFDSVAKGEAVPVEHVQPHMVAMTKKILKDIPAIKAILLECTELPPYADALRAKTGLPVWDAITGADFYVNACKDNPRFGINDWQDEWDEEQEEYQWGQNLIESDKKAVLVGSYAENHHNKSAAMRRGAKMDPAAKAKAKAAAAKTKKKMQKAQAPILGVVRLDYNYPPAAGDIDCPGSYDYDVLYRCVPGLTFDMAQSGKMTYQVQQDFVQAVRWLENKGASGITGDCGFMMAFQMIAAQAANIPVFMSSMVQCPMVSCAYDKFDKILILTANSETLKPQKEVLMKKCGFDVVDSRFVIVGCQNVEHFDAVEKGQKVDVEKVTPGMVTMVRDVLQKEPYIRAIILECTELPPYSDALRAATDLPVWDAITCADFFISARRDNPRFGMNQWQNDWDGQQDDYELGANLTASDHARVQQLKV